jgi:CBS domain-containing protein
MNVEAVMTRFPAFCTPETSIEEAARLMVEFDCGAIPVVESRQLQRAIGVVTDRDIVCRVVAKGLNPVGMRVQAIMSQPLASVTPDTEVGEVANLMQSSQVRRLPVVGRDGILCGMVTQADLALSLTRREAGEILEEVSKPSAGPSQVESS